MITYETIPMILLMVALLPFVVAILAGWTRSTDLKLRRRAEIAMQITNIGGALVLLSVLVVQVVQGNYVLAAAAAVAVCLLVLAWVASRAQLRAVDHEIQTGEVYAVSAEARARNLALMRSILSLAVVLIILFIAGLVTSSVFGF